MTSDVAEPDFRNVPIRLVESSHGWTAHCDQCGTTEGPISDIQLLSKWATEYHLLAHHQPRTQFIVERINQDVPPRSGD